VIDFAGKVQVSRSATPVKVDVAGATEVDVSEFTASGAAAGVVTLAFPATLAPPRSTAVRAAADRALTTLTIRSPVFRSSGPVVLGDDLTERLGRLVVGEAAPLLAVEGEGDLPAAHLDVGVVGAAGVDRAGLGDQCRLAAVDVAGLDHGVLGGVGGLDVLPVLDRPAAAAGVRPPGGVTGEVVGEQRVPVGAGHHGRRR
jgi:hypothetical protein